MAWRKWKWHHTWIRQAAAAKAQEKVSHWRCRLRAGNNLSPENWSMDFKFLCQFRGNLWKPMETLKISNVSIGLGNVSRNVSIGSKVSMKSQFFPEHLEEMSRHWTWSPSKPETSRHWDPRKRKVTPSQIGHVLVDDCYIYILLVIIVTWLSRKLASASWSLLALASIPRAAQGHHVIFHAKGGDPPTTTITTIIIIVIIIVIIIISSSSSSSSSPSSSSSSSSSLFNYILSLLAIIGIITKASVSSLESSCFCKYSGAPQGHHVIFHAKGPPPCPLPHIYHCYISYIIVASSLGRTMPRHNVDSPSATHLFPSFFLLPR